MTVLPTAYAPRVLADLVPGRVARGRVARDAALVGTGAGLVGLAAQVAIHTPLTPVPFTLQTLAVLGVGSALGSRRGVLALALYALAGVAGVPWFAAHTSGWGGPSFGYVLGFVAAAAVTGKLAERRADRSVLGTISIMVAGSALIYLAGTLWLAHALSLPASRAIDLGVRPFLVSDLIKCALAVIALPGAWKLTTHLAGRPGRKSR
jgi:biotin transport system substrate-specific component